MPYCQQCGQELLPRERPANDRRVMTLDFCDERCEQDWRREQSVASFDAYRLKMNGVRRP
jgi:hypothetical protein